MMDKDEKVRKGTEAVREFAGRMREVGVRVEWSVLHGSLQPSVVLVVPAWAVDVAALAMMGEEEDV